MNDATDGSAVAIVNPVAGGGRGPRLWYHARRRLAEAGRSFVTWRCERPGHAVELGRRAARQGFATVLAVGGDGTVNEVLNGLLTDRSGAATPALACLPTGTGNDFARGLGIECPADAIDALLRPCRQAADVGFAQGVDGRPRAFANALSVGLGAEIADGLTARSRRLGPPAFTLVALAAIARHRSTTAALRVDGARRELGRVALLVVANGRWAAGGMQVAPPARADDGLLDMVAVAAVPRLELALRLLPAARGGGHFGHPAVSHVTGRHFAIESLARYEVDGEVIGRGPVEVWLEPGALTVVARRRSNESAARTASGKEPVAW